MSSVRTPRPFEEWRSNPHDRAEDAAYTFGYHLMHFCRDEALKAVAQPRTPDASSAVEKAVDIALHNVVDLFEGFFRAECGEQHMVRYELRLWICDEQGRTVEKISICPTKLDLPIGYWKWRDEEFR